MVYEEKDKAISVRVNERRYKKIQEFIRANSGYGKKLGWHFTFADLVTQAMQDFCKKYKID
ncbi:MAG: hypothetical protein E7378_03200 [Clostridiales bacterium]|nr:hypothetical protein [Clostridiales bacterium]